MRQEDIDKLQSIKDFPSLVAHLRDELDWPIEVRDADEVVFEYDPRELGIDPKYAVKIESIRQIRPLVDTQPWAIFYIEFESKRLPVVVLRRILRELVHTSRRRDPDRPAWRMDDLLFISAQGKTADRSISFAHFHRREGRIPELRTFSWDTRESHFYYLKYLNLESLRWPDDEHDSGAWRNRWSQAFLVPHLHVIRKSQQLARELARHAATVRELVDEVFELETQEGALHRLYDSFKEALLHDLKPQGFADMVAQTVAYGLFSARTQSDQLTFDRMVDLIPGTNPFLKDLLAELTTEGTVDLEELGVGQLVELLRQTDIEAILRDFGRRTGAGREDPVVHFYELFLREYDREQKVKRGVFYTPDPVVSYIVRSVDHLLKTEFGLADGLADTTANSETGEPLVQILDPAVGTGTFLVHVIDQVERTVMAKPGVDWSDYVAEHLLPRLNGFELMMAPYAVGHVKLGLKLDETGYNFAGDERLRVYLTNSLEKPIEMDDTLALAGFLSKESNEAARVKRRTPVSVVIGNPPYSVSSANKGPHIERLMERYKEAVREERNIQPLSDDYIKFIRFAHECIERTGWGIIGMITNHSYLSGVIHRGMRQELLRTFDTIHVLNLHGNLLRKERAPDGSEDENVFDIQPGVAIALFLKKGGTVARPQVKYAGLWGLREDKYEYLLGNDVSTSSWQELNPAAPYFFFEPKAFDRGDEYEKNWSVADILPTNSGAIKTHRDHLVVGLDEEVLRQRMQVLCTLEVSDEEIAQRFRLRDTGTWRLAEARRILQRDSDWVKKLYQCLYRPFDVRWLVYDDALLDRPRREVMQHMLHDNLALLCKRQSKREPFSYAFVTSRLTESAVMETTYALSNAFPLFLYTEPGWVAGELVASAKLTRSANLSPEFIAVLRSKLGLRFVPDSGGNLEGAFTPEDILHYAYAIFHSPAYRDRYSEFLKIDFPRLPVTSDVALFCALATLGADLVALHLLEDTYAAASWNHRGGQSPLLHPGTAFIRGENGTTVGAVSKGKCYRDRRVYLDTSRRASSSYFEGVPEEVWKFHIGGYQVCHKWLYDRRGRRGEPGRTLTEDDIAHYQRMVVAIKETIRLMQEIDDVIDAHGGWPIE